MASKELPTEDRNSFASLNTGAKITTEMKLQFLQISSKLYEVFNEIQSLGEDTARPVGDTTALAITRLKKIVAARTRRNRVFPEHHFSDPAWDMILDLAIAMGEHRLVSVSSLCIAGNVPTTTALRCIKQLIDQGVIVVAPDPSDKRRKYTKLSDETYSKMIEFAHSKSKS